MSELSKEEIKQICLKAGFKEKQQPDGTMDLNSYVYDAAYKIIAKQKDVWSAPPPPQPTLRRY